MKMNVGSPEPRQKRRTGLLRGVWLSAVLGLAVWGTAVAQERLSLSFAAARALALERNAQVRAAASDVEGARGAHLRAWARQLPHIVLSEQATRSNDAVGVFGTKLRQERFTQADFSLDALNRPDAVTGFRTTLEVRQPLVDLGAVYARQEAAEGVNQARAGLRRWQQAVVLETAEAYWAVCLAQASLHSARHSVDEAEALLGAAQARLRQEAATRADALGAQARLAQRRAQEIEAAAALAAARDRLTLVLGLDADTALEPLDGLDFFWNEDEERAPADSLVRVALARRPDLHVGSARLAAARKGVGAAKAAFVPRLDVFARADLDADGLLARQGESWSAGLAMRWELFSGFERVGALRQARARLARNEAENTRLAAQVERQVRAASRAVATARGQVGLGTVARDWAVEALAVSRKRYEQGLATAAEVLAAEAEVSQARLGRLKALYGFNMALSELAFAVGESVE